MANSSGSHDRDLDIRIGHDELVIRQRYEALSIGNDVLIALWFLVGSILFFFESTTYAATWCFLLGSIEFLVRPLLRFARLFHLRRFNPDATGSSDDF